MGKITTTSVALLAGFVLVSASAAQDGIFDEYREMMGDDNPAVFVIDEGEEYWFTPAGPRV